MRAKAAVLNVGSELLHGERQNTNSFFLAQQLRQRGIHLIEIKVLPDEEEVIQESLKALDADLVVITGGLGPTDDDRTRFAVARAFRRKLITSRYWSHVLRKNLSRFFPPELVQKNLVQALIPQGASVLKNRKGTACGFYFRDRKRWILCLPGPPSEMQPMFIEFLEKVKLRSSPVPSAVLRTVCLPESEIGEILRKIDLPGVRAVSLLQDTEVHVHLRAKTEEQLHEAIAVLKAKLYPYWYGLGDETLEKVVGHELLQKKLTLSLAESCTGGWVGRRLTSVPGISRAFLAGVVAYSNEAKRKLLGVDNNTLKKFGAVSEPCARQMAQNARKLMGSDIGLSITGIAGPGGGTKRKPVGLTYLGICDKKKNEVKRIVLSGDRELVRKRAADAALHLLLEYLRCACF